MKKLISIAAICALTALNASAPTQAEQNQRGAQMGQKKQIALQILDARIADLRNIRECVASANTREDMQKCNEIRKGINKKNQDMRERFKQRRDNRSQERR